MRSRRASGVDDWLEQSVAAFLLLSVPLTLFLRHQRYGFATTEVFLLLLALAGLGLLLGAVASLSTGFEVVTIAALLTWWADIQLLNAGAKWLVLLFVVLCLVTWILRAHARRIASLMTATVIAASLLPMRPAVAEASRPAGAPVVERTIEAAGDRLPLIVHLILDEHIGLEGIPEDLAPASFKDEARTFFTDKGFKVFGGAYSEHPWTLQSISHLLNLAASRNDSSLYAPGPTGGTNRLTRNAYFERFRSAGFAIRAYHPDYLDECAGQVTPSDCHGYAETSLRVVHHLPVSASQKASVLAEALLAQSEAFVRIEHLYRRIRQRPVWGPMHLPASNFDSTIVAPVATMQALDVMTTDLAQSRPGELFFAHLLLPHFPYAYDANCRVRPPAEWRLRGEKRGANDGGGRTNTPESRAERYALYFEQVTCAHRMINQLLAAVPAGLRQDAILIVQGDHGSRIGRNDPTAENESTYSHADYADFYSTLFAVRAPRLEAGYEVEPMSIICLLRSLVDSRFSTTAAAAACSSERVVFFKDRTRHVLPNFISPRPGLGASTTH